MGRHAATVRNVAIIVAIAAVIEFAPGGRTGGAVIAQALQVAFLGALVLFVARFYLERRFELFGLEDRVRGALYASVAALTFALAATGRLFDVGAGAILLWFALLGAGIFGLVFVVRSYRRY